MDESMLTGESVPVMKVRILYLKSRPVPKEIIHPVPASGPCLKKLVGNGISLPCCTPRGAEVSHLKGSLKTSLCAGDEAYK